MAVHHGAPSPIHTIHTALKLVYIKSIMHFRQQCPICGTANKSSGGEKRICNHREWHNVVKASELHRSFPLLQAHKILASANERVGGAPIAGLHGRQNLGQQKCSRFTAMHVASNVNVLNRSTANHQNCPPFLTSRKKGLEIG